MILNEIITGISEAIKAEFGEDYGVYTELVEQGLNEPCFSIVCVSPKSSRFLETDTIKRTGSAYTTTLLQQM